MFTIAISETVVIGLLELRHVSEFFQLVESDRERLKEWCPWVDAVSSIEKTQLFIREKLERFCAGNGFTAGIFENRKLIGAIALEYIDVANSATEIGYWLARDVVGRGIVTNSCKVLIDHAFNELGLHRIQIRCASQNLRSRAIPEKLGFAHEGIVKQCERLHDRTVDLAIYGLLRSEWTSQKSQE